jgi:hypothetical protein
MKQQIDSQLVGELYASACQLCSTAGVVENVWFKESPSAMATSIAELREVLYKFSMILYGRTYAEATNNQGR